MLGCRRYSLAPTFAVVDEDVGAISISRDEVGRIEKKVQPTYVE